VGTHPIIIAITAMTTEVITKNIPVAVVSAGLDTGEKRKISVLVGNRTPTARYSS
jgi:hypothetical protein